MLSRHATISAWETARKKKKKKRKEHFSDGSPSLGGLAAPNYVQLRPSALQLLVSHSWRLALFAAL